MAWTGGFLDYALAKGWEAVPEKWPEPPSSFLVLLLPSPSRSTEQADTVEGPKVGGSEPPKGGRGAQSREFWAPGGGSSDPAVLDEADFLVLGQQDTRGTRG